MAYARLAAFLAVVLADLVVDVLPSAFVDLLPAGLRVDVFLPVDFLAAVCVLAAFLPAVFLLVDFLAAAFLAVLSLVVVAVLPSLAGVRVPAFRLRCSISVKSWMVALAGVSSSVSTSCTAEMSPASAFSRT